MAICKVHGSLCDGREPLILHSPETGLFMTKLPSGTIHVNNIGPIKPSQLCAGMGMDLGGEVYADFIAANFDRICQRLLQIRSGVIGPDAPLHHITIV